MSLYQCYWFPVRIIWHLPLHSSSFSPVFSFPGWLVLSYLWRGKSHPLLLMVSFPRNLILKVVRVSEKAECHEPSALLGQSKTPPPAVLHELELWLQQQLGTSGHVQGQQSDYFEEDADEVQKLYAWFIRALTAMCRYNILSPPNTTLLSVPLIFRHASKADLLKQTESPCGSSITSASPIPMLIPAFPLWRKP